MEKTDRSGFLWFPRALKRREMFPDLCAAVDWVRKGSHHTAWSVPSTSSCSCSYAYGHGKAVGPQTGEQFWPLLVRLRRAIAPLMKTWCAGGEVASAANLNLYRGGNCMFVGTGDDESWGGEACCVGKFRHPSALQIEGQVLSGRVKLACVALAMVTFLSWMANVRTSFFIVRIPVWNGSGLTLRSVGSGNILPPVTCGQG